MKFQGLLEPRIRQSSEVLWALNTVKLVYMVYNGFSMGRKHPQHYFLPYITDTFSLINTKQLNLHYISHGVYAAASDTWKH